MRSFNGPRVGSRAYQALEQLYAMGGSVNLVAWVRALEWRTSDLEFDRLVLAPLVAIQHIVQRDRQYVITDSGMVRIGVMDAPAVPSGIVAGPRYVPSQRELAARHLARVRMTREGALDYRDIPSRMGNALIPYGEA